MTRTLVTWHLVQHDHLPIVVTRDDRGDYIDALETADDGNLGKMVNFRARLHRRLVMQALSTLGTKHTRRAAEASQTGS